MFSMTKVIHSKSNAFSINAIFNWFLNLFNQILDQDLEPRRSRCGFKRKSKFGSGSGSKLNADTDQKHLLFPT